MSHFYGSMSGMGNSEATKRGTEKTGISCHVRGWNFGVKVFARFNDKTGRDEYDIYSTGGSNGASNDIFIKTIKPKGK